MTAALRRGACPTLAAPMLTGDGWLARLALPDGVTPVRLAGLAAAASRFGNGLVEVTGRGSLQIRGLAEASAPQLAAALDALGVRVAAGPPVLTGPLAGLDPAEVADPRPVAAELRSRAAGLGLERRLHPKVSVVVDGGGGFPLHGIAADVRLRASSGEWQVSVGGRSLGRHAASGAIDAALEALGNLAERGARDSGRCGSTPSPIGRFALADGRVARGLGLPFGQADAAMLAALSAAAAAPHLQPAPGRALIALGLTPEADRALVAAAGRLGFVTEPDDPRLAIVACSGAPACASAHLATRSLAARLAAFGPAPPEGARLHLSGCAKRCAQPAGAAVTLIGAATGRMVTGEGVAVPQDLRALLLEAGA